MLLLRFDIESKSWPCGEVVYLVQRLQVASLGLRMSASWSGSVLPQYLL